MIFPLQRLEAKFFQENPPWHFLSRLVGLGLLLALSCSAQNTQITGRVTDPSLASIAGAKVVAQSLDTGVERTSKTNGDGYYAFPLLTRGRYSLSTSADGFKAAKIADVNLDEGQAARFDFSLALGQVSESIEVSGSAALLETENATTSAVVTNQKIVDLPLVNRNIMGLTSLIPGVRPTANLGAIERSGLNSLNASIGGGAPSANNSLVDGVAADEGFFGQITISLSVDATEEFRIITHNASAEFGHTGGGVVNVTSKAGTNDFHGALFEYFRNRELNANDFFANRVGSPRAQFNYNNFGAAVGGPVLIPKTYNGRNKTFFFFNWEEYKQRTSSQTFRTVPTDLQRKGDFSQTLTAQGAPITIYDPITTRPDPSRAGSYLRDAFPGNVIPASRLNPVALKVMAYYPGANQPGTKFAQANNFFGVASSPIDKLLLGLRGDHYFTPTRRAFARVTRDKTPQGLANYFGNIAEPNTSDITFIRNSAVIGYSDSIRPTLLFEGRLGYNDYQTPRKNRSRGFDVTTIGLPGSLNPQLQQPIFPLFNIGDVTAIGSSPGDDIRKANRTFSGSGGVTWVHGAHISKFGGEARLYRGFDSQLTGDVLTFNFDRGFTQGPNPNTASSAAGFGLASFLLGTPSSGNATRADTVAYSERYMALYAQDDWKLTPKLTLNGGLRWDYQSPFTDRYNGITNFDPATKFTSNGIPMVGALVFPGQNGLPTGDREARMPDFAPRLGVSYQIIPKTVIRAAYGLFYLPITGLSSRLGQTGFSINSAMTTSSDGGLTPLNTISNPYPAGIALPVGSTQGPLTGLGTSVSANPRSLGGGYSQQWSFDIEREFAGKWLLQVGYTGNRGVSLPVNYAYHHLPQDDLKFGTQLQQLVSNPYAGIITTGPLSLSQVTMATLLQTYPQFLGVSGLENWGNSIYHALTVRFEKRFSSGLSFLAAYTYSKTIDDSLRGSFAAGGSNSVANWDNLRAERAISSIDLPQRLVISTSYQLPFDKVNNRALRYVARGWQLNGILTLQSGDPIAVTQNTPTFGSFRPNAVGDPTNSDPTIDHWLNLAAFTAAPAFTFGNAPRNLPRTRTDGYQNLDFSIFRVFTVRENMRLQFRGEAINLTNTPTFGAPGANINSSSFGVITSISSNATPRQLQLGLKLAF
jgi:outer membrane receptor protein involved in Fe transport